MSVSALRALQFKIRHAKPAIPQELFPRFAAKNLALIYNWWRWFVRLANPKARLEVIPVLCCITF
jgi:hypothetical protein